MSTNPEDKEFLGRYVQNRYGSREFMVPGNLSRATEQRPQHDSRLCWDNHLSYYSTEFDLARTTEELHINASSGTPPMFGWTDSPSNFSHERHKIPSISFCQNADMDFRDDENVMFEPEGQNYQKIFRDNPRFDHDRNYETMRLHSAVHLTRESQNGALSIDSLPLCHLDGYTTTQYHEAYSPEGWGSGYSGGWYYPPPHSPLDTSRSSDSVSSDSGQGGVCLGNS
ncbi:hypothetical protein BDD12DRAFT_889785 [Trichophaea hybrida]|nr:hypothetical protein BDD12DRAFT_889785 [Trichophaea hybrida]